MKLTRSEINTSVQLVDLTSYYTFFVAIGIQSNVRLTVGLKIFYIITDSIFTHSVYISMQLSIGFMFAGEYC